MQDSYNVFVTKCTVCSASMWQINQQGRSMELTSKSGVCVLQGEYDVDPDGKGGPTRPPEVGPVLLLHIHHHYIIMLSQHCSAQLILFAHCSCRMNSNGCIVGLLSRCRVDAAACVVSIRWVRSVSDGNIRIWMDMFPNMATNNVVWQTDCPCTDTR